MAREPAHIAQPQRPGRVPIRRQRRPFHREPRRDGLGLALLHESDEVAEPPGLLLVPWGRLNIRVKIGHKPSRPGTGPGFSGGGTSAMSRK